MSPALEKAIARRTILTQVNTHLNTSILIVHDPGMEDANAIEIDPRNA
jgi:hypothetical protein